MNCSLSLGSINVFGISFKPDVHSVALAVITPSPGIWLICNKHAWLIFFIVVCNIAYSNCLGCAQLMGWLLHCSASCCMSICPYICTSVLPSFYHTFLAWEMQQNLLDWFTSFCYGKIISNSIAHLLIFLVMFAMTDYQTKNNPQKILFYNIDQLAQPCSL